MREIRFGSGCPEHFDDTPECNIIKGFIERAGHKPLQVFDKLLECKATKEIEPGIPNPLYGAKISLIKAATPNAQLDFDFKDHGVYVKISQWGRHSEQTKFYSLTLWDDQSAEAIEYIKRNLDHRI